MENFVFSKASQLIVMLTFNDLTVENAEEIFEQCKDTKVLLWGIKEEPLAPERMKSLFKRMKACGKTTFLEVVSYDLEGALKGAALAIECGCDIMMGTMFHQEVMELLHQNGIRYMPFVGKIKGRPSVLTGTIEDIVEEARNVIAKGADGIDLLGYRYEGNAPLLNQTLVEGVDAPICIAGSIDSYQRIDEVKSTGAWAFTIGSAFFEHQFGESFADQINQVCTYIND